MSTNDDNNNEGVIVVDRKGNVYTEAAEKIDECEEEGYPFLLIAPAAHPDKPTVMGMSIITPMLDREDLINMLSDALEAVKRLRN